jgi:hypothetical protein
MSGEIMCGMCIEAVMLDCISNGRIDLSKAKEVCGESYEAFNEPHFLTELATGVLPEAETLFSKYPSDATVIWSILYHNQYYTFSDDKIKCALDVLHTDLLKEQEVINKTLSMRLTHLFSAMHETPLSAATKIDGIFEKMLLRNDLDLVVSDVELFLSTLCGFFISRTEQHKLETFTHSENGITDEQVNNIFSNCPISIFIAKWFLQRLVPRSIIHDLIPVVESPVPFFCSYYMAWRRHATLWLFHHRDESEFLHLLPNMYIESLFYIKNVIPVPTHISSEIDKRLDTEFLGC